MKYSEYTAVQMAFSEKQPPEDLPASAELSSRKCLRRVPAREWVHKGWRELARVVAVACYITHGCRECEAMLLERNMRR